MNNTTLYNVIFERLKKEEDELTTLNNQGVFYAPELYIAFILGKEIKKNEIQIFGNKVNWVREINFGNGGPTDFAFESESESKTYVFELKLRDTLEAYSSDIEKLKRLDNRYVKYFIALVDTWENKEENDIRIKELEKKYYQLKRISPISSFPSKQSRYKNNVTCTVGLWRLNK